MLFRSDAPSLVSAAHALKGSAAYLGAARVRACAADLEQLGRDGEMAGARERCAALDAAVAELDRELRKAS